MIIREATSADAARLAEIYAYYVLNTAITFEIDAPDEKEFARRIKKTEEKYPYIVCGEEGRVLGYAYASPLKGRAAYYPSVELSVYIDKDVRGKGIGKALYAELEKRLKKQNITNLYACITYADSPDEYLTDASVKFHLRMGFKEVGEFHNCAEKFGNRYGVKWLEKFL